MKPPPNITVCSACYQEGCNGHPITGMIIVLGLVALPTLIALVLINA